MRRSLIAALSLVGTIIASPPAQADDAQQVFDSLYAAKIKAAAGTIDRADDVALAGDLLAAAKTSTDTPGLLTLMCEAAHDLGQRHPDGFSAAADAMALLAEHVEAKRDAANDKLIDILTKQSRIGKVDEREAATQRLVDTLLAMGDAKMEAKKWSEAAADYRRAMLTAAPKKLPEAEVAKAKLEEATRLDRTTRQLSKLQQRLLENANDAAAAEEIARLYLLDLNEPGRTQEVASRVEDSTLKQVVELVNRPIRDLTTSDRLRLGEWYYNAAKSLRGIPKATTLHRADAHFGAALDDKQMDNLSRTKAELISKDIQAELASLVETEIRPPTSNTSESPRRYLPMTQFDKLFTQTDGFSVKGDIVSGRVGDIDTGKQPILDLKVKGKSFRFGLKMKAPSYQCIWTEADGVPFIYSRGHWLNAETAVKGNNKDTIRLREKVDAPTEFALLEVEYDGTEVRYFYNGKLSLSDKVTKPTGSDTSFRFGFRSHQNSIEVKDIYLIVDGKPMVVGRGR